LATPPAPEPRADERLDLTGVPCPANTARALLAIEWMDEGRILEILVDDGEPIENVPPSLVAEGHTILLEERAGPGWRVLVRKG